MESETWFYNMYKCDPFIADKLNDFGSIFEIWNRSKPNPLFG